MDNILNKTNELLLELNALRACQLLDWDIAIIYPVCYQAGVLKRAINLELSKNNFITAASLTRSLMESVMVMNYALSFEETDKVSQKDFYSKFLESGRLQKFSKKKKIWKNVRDIDDLIPKFKEILNLDLQSDYEKLCNILHFSTSQIHEMISDVSDDGSFSFVLPNQSTPLKEIRPDKLLWIRQLVEMLEDTINFCISKEIFTVIHQKNLRQSKIAEDCASQWLQKYQN